jgi:hypothetical protein
MVYYIYFSPMKFNKMNKGEKRTNKAQSVLAIK